MHDLDLESLTLEPHRHLHADWGGAGSDLDRPVRTHVLAALPLVTEPYPPPLDGLLTLGDVDSEEAVTLADFGQEHVAFLLRMARDRALVMASVEQPESFAPFHALSVLAELDLSAHVNELIPLLDTDLVELVEEAVEILGAAGLPALAPLLTYIGDTTRWNMGRSHVLYALEKIIDQHPETRNQVVATLSELIQHAEAKHAEFVSFAIGSLINLKAVEQLPLIREAFVNDKIDTTITGSWSATLKSMGVEPEADDPLIVREREQEKERQRLYGMASQAEPLAPKNRSRPTSKAKAKAKIAKDSRKANRKKKRK